MHRTYIAPTIDNGEEVADSMGSNQLHGSELDLVHFLDGIPGLLMNRQTVVKRTEEGRFLTKLWPPIKLHNRSTPASALVANPELQDNQL